MGTKKHRPEEVVAKLRQVDVLVSQGRRACIEHVRTVLTVSERRACRALGQHPSS